MNFWNYFYNKMLKFLIITFVVFPISFANEIPRLEKRGKCLFFVGVERYIKETVEVQTINHTLYLKGVEDLQKEGDPYFYYKFDIPQKCKGKPMLGFTEFGINVLIN